MAERNICSVDLLQTMSENTNVIVDENGTLNKLNIYNEFNHVNTKIDNEIDTVNTNMSQFSNPNLLINSDFRNLINQRDKTEYTSNASDFVKVYTIDRWFIQHGCTLTVNENSITITNNSGDVGYFGQSFEKELVAGYYTTTLEVLNVSGEVIMPGGKDLAKVGKNVVTENTTSPSQGTVITLNSGSSIELKLWKLEHGSIATPYMIKSPEEEVSLCQRYLQEIECLGVCNDFELGTWYMIGVPFTTSMRINPTIESYSVLDSGFGSVNVSISESYIDTDGIYKIILNNTGEKKMYFFKLLLSAEIY